MLKKTIIALATASALTLVGAPALAQSTSAGLSANYSTFAGSQKNAEALVSGLRSDSTITLTANPAGPNPNAPSATFSPATGPLGWGNVNIALALAQADLGRLGITQPTPAQLAAALNGGTIMTATGPVTMAGVLAERSGGMGWGKIAQSMGVKLGSIVSASKTDNAKAGVSVANTGKGSEHASGNSRGGGNSNAGGNSGGGHGNSGAAHGGGGGGGDGGGHGGGHGGGDGGGGGGGGHGGGDGGGGGGGHGGGDGGGGGGGGGGK